MRSIISPPKAGDKLETVEFDPHVRSKANIEAYLLRYCKERVKCILDRCAAFLDMENLDDEARMELVEIWVDAARPLVQVQTHRSRLLWTRPKQMFGDKFDKSRMKAHRSQSQKESVGNVAEAQVSLVMSPLLFMEGDESGQDPSAKRVLLPAVVLVLDGSEEC